MLPKFIVGKLARSANGLTKFMPRIIKFIAPINELANNSKPFIKPFSTVLTTFLKPSNFVYAIASPVMTAPIPIAISVKGLAAIAKLTAKIATAIALIVLAINKNALGFCCAQSAIFCKNGNTFCNTGSRPAPMLSCVSAKLFLSILN